MGAGWTCRGPARPRRAASSSVPAVGEGRPQWPPSPGVATHPYPLQRDGVPAGTLIAQGQSGDSGPQRLLEFPLCFLERVLPESGSLGATTWTSQACPVTPPLCAQETPISDSCTKKSLQRAQPRGTEGLPGLSVDRALQGLMDRGCTHSPEGCWAKATPHVRWAWSSTPVLHLLVPRALSLCEGLLCVLWLCLLTGRLFLCPSLAMIQTPRTASPWAPSVSAPVSAGSSLSGSSDDEPSACSGR